MDRSWLLAAATGGGGPPQLAGVLLDRGRPILVAAAFGYGDGSSDTTVSFVDDAGAGVVSVDVVDRDGERRARAFLNIDGAGLLSRLVAVFDTVDQATGASTRQVFVLSSTQSADAAAPAPAPILLALLPPQPIEVEELYDYVIIDIPNDIDEDPLEPDDEAQLPPLLANMQLAVGVRDNPADRNTPAQELIQAVDKIMNLLHEQAVMDLSPSEWSKMVHLVIEIHEHIPEAYQVELEDLVVERRFQRLRRSRRLMLRSFLWNIGVSFLSHIALYLLSAHFSETESAPTSLHDQRASPPMPPSDAKESALLISWGIQKVLSPALLVFIIWLVKACVIDREVQLMAYSNNNIVNFFINSLSKILFFAAKEFPLVKNTSLIAHICSFIVDFSGALLLLMKQGFWDQDVADA